MVDGQETRKAQKYHPHTVGNTQVYTLRDSHLIESLLSDTSKFVKIATDGQKELNHILSQERKVTDVLKNLLEKGRFDESLYKKLNPTGSKLGVLYGLCKVHKPSVNGCPPFRPILSAIDTPTYNIAKFLVPHLAPITRNEFTVKDSFAFAEEIRKQDANLYMASLDVDSLFTNVPLEETIDICVNAPFKIKVI